MGRSTRGSDYQYVPRPVAALADEYPAGHLDPRHSHVRAQLIYASAGIMTVTTAAASYVVPPQRAVWIPGGVEHEVYCREPVRIRTLYVAEAEHDRLPTTCRVIEVSDLLRELIIEATEIPVEYDLDGRDGRVMALILDEISTTRTTRLHVPMPQNERLIRVCSSILKDPASNDAMDEWADLAGMCRRTFTRMFRRETGMSFACWRQNVRLMEAVSRLSQGHSVTTVAFDVGYNSPSAFTAMFRRTFGVAPTVYLSAGEEQQEQQQKQPVAALG
jgi:AraC-like DNA-binding protein